MGRAEQVLREQDVLMLEIDRCFPEGALRARIAGKRFEAEVAFDALGRNVRHEVRRDDFGGADSRACVARVLAEQAVRPPLAGPLRLAIPIPPPTE